MKKEGVPIVGTPIMPQLFTPFLYLCSKKV